MRRLLPAGATLAAAFACAAPAAAQQPLVPGTMTDVGEVVAVTSSNGAAPTYTPTVDGATITTGSPRTIIDFRHTPGEPGSVNGIQQPAGRRLTIEFADASHGVLLRTGGRAELNGTLTATLGSGGLPGGAVWVAARTGVALGANARIDAGGFLATSGSVETTPYLGGSSINLLGMTEPVVAQSGAQVTGHGGIVGLVGATVAQHAGSTVGAASGDALQTRAETEVVYAAANDVSLSWTGAAGIAPDLLSVTPVSPAATGSQSGLIDLAGSTTAGDVFVASRGTGPVSLSSVTAVTAAGTGGDVAASAGGGISRATELADPVAGRAVGAAPQAVVVSGAVNAAALALLRGTGNLTIADVAAAQVTANVAALSTDLQFHNLRSPTAVNAATRWVVYAAHPDPDGNTYGDLNSFNRARWDADIDSLPPSSFSTRKYVFRFAPTLTFTSQNATKTWSEDTRGSLPYTSTGVRAGVQNAFLGDNGRVASTGEPAVTSDGAHPDAIVDDGPFPIAIALGTLESAVGYRFAFASTGTLTVAPIAGDRPPTVVPVIAGTPGANGWHVSDVGLSWAVADPDDDDVVKTGCEAASVTSDTAAFQRACSVVARGRRIRGTATIKRDVTPPVLSGAAVSGGQPYAEGSTAAGDVEVRFTCTDGGSGPAPGAQVLPPVVVTAEGETALVPNGGVCADNAGNVTRSWFGPVRIARPPTPATPSPRPPAGPPAPVSPGGDAAALADRQAADAVKVLRRLGLERLLGKGYRRRLAAAAAGAATEEVLLRRGGRLLVVARGTLRFAGPGTATLVVRPTKAGRAALRGKRRAKLLVRSGFAPASGGPPGSRTRAVTV